MHAYIHAYIHTCIHTTIHSLRFVGMEGIYRVLEKGVFKYNDALEGHLDLSQVRDLVRGGIIDASMEGLTAIANFIFTSEDVTICRVKNLFGKPSLVKWPGLTLNLYFNTGVPRRA